MILDHFLDEEVQSGSFSAMPKINYDNLPGQLDDLRDRLADASKQTKSAKVSLDAAQARYDEVRADEDIIRRMLDDVARALQRAHAAVQQPPTAQAGAALPNADGGQDADGDDDSDSSPDGTDDKTDSRASSDDSDDKTASKDASEDSGDGGDADTDDVLDLSDVRPSFRDLIDVMPRNGDVGMDDLRAAFPKLTDGGINSRITKAKRAGLVGSPGWGRYDLTDEGKKIKDQLIASSGLRLVTSNGDD